MDQLLHYCSSESFLSIARTKSIRLSSRTLSNDSLEGKLVRATIRKLAERDKLSEEGVRWIDVSTSRLESIFDGLGFCLSAAPDR
jgi:hypothetical protein